MTAIFAFYPYTRLLLKAVPDISKPFLPDDVLTSGEIPNPTCLPKGCFFAPRCPEAMPECSKAHPELRKKDSGYSVRCIFP
jgi:peptide/nickel transport system ATP-binding protein